MQLAKTVNENSILVSVGVHRLGIRRDVSSEKLKVKGQTSVDTTDPEMIRATKKLVKSKEYDAIIKLDGAFYREIQRRVIPSNFRRGVYLLPLKLLDWFEEEYKKYEDKRESLVDAFIGVYDERVSEAREKLGTLFRARDYPSARAARSAFWVEKGYESIGVPDKLRDINQELFDNERKRLKRSMEEAAQEVRVTLRAGLLELVEHLQTRLQPNDEGKVQRLHKTAVTNLTGWLELFEARDITNDQELSDLVSKLKSVTEGRDRDTLRDDETVRGQVTSTLSDVKTSLNSMVTDARRRVFNLDDDDE